VLRHEPKRMQRVKRAKDGRMLDDARQACRGQCEEPHDGDGSKKRPDRRGAMALGQEQHDEHACGYRQHVGLEGGGAHVETLDRRKDGNGRCQHSVTVKERGAKQAHEQNWRKRSAQLFHRRRGEREQRHDAAFALVVRPHDEDHVFERDDQLLRSANRQDNAVTRPAPTIIWSRLRLR